MSDLFRMRPMSVDGAPVGGAKVIIPIGFRQPADYLTGPVAEPAGAPASPKALEIARHIATLTFPPDQIAAFLARTRDNLSGQLADVSLTEEQQSAVDGLMSALQAAVPTMLDVRAEKLAGRLSAADLAQVDAFLSTAAGRDWLALLNDNSQTEYVRMWSLVRQNVRTQFCQKYECPNFDAPAPPTSPAPAS
jgi:hypothetical protein